MIDSIPIQNPEIQVGRLSMRVEAHVSGPDYWNAYYAQNDTMEGAIFLGSIAMQAIEDRPDRKEAFMAMMRDIVGDILEGVTGVRPNWHQPVVAPESERQR
jgi:hypothetical protein